jgi:3D (Asp-Asp-Asp) domain-containing protein
MTRLAPALLVAAAAGSSASGACTSNEAWIRGSDDAYAKSGMDREGWDEPPPLPAPPPPNPPPSDAERKPRPGAVRAPATALEPWRNTYYDFPAEETGTKGATVFDASCKPIARVTQAFHDKVCVQGSGSLVTGETVSFAKRDCACAAVCPRTSQRICFEKLDPRRFPHGRGAAGTAITPFRSVAVDVSLVPLGTALFIPAYRGLTRPDGTVHDGCFLAEDRGLKVVGRHVDIFTGSEDGTVAWNRAVPSNGGVEVVVGAKQCPASLP